MNKDNFFTIESFKGLAPEMFHGVEMRHYRERPSSLIEMLERSVAQYGDHEAVVDDNVRLTYKEFDGLCNNLAASLRDLGVKRGDRVGILMRNSWEYAVAYYGIAQLGAIAVLLNWRCAAPELEYMLKDSESVVLLMAMDFWSTISEIYENIDTLKNIYAVGENIPEAAGDFKDLIRNDPGEKIVADPPLREDDVAAILYTSGTTGLPKGAMQMHRNCIANAMNLALLTGGDRGGRTLIIAPMFHATAINGQLNTFIFRGGCSVIRPEFAPLDTLAKIQDEKITLGAGVATMFWIILNSTPYQDYDLSSLKFFIFGGSPVPVELFNQMIKAFPNVKFGNVYGLTEATSTSTLNAHEDIIRVPDSVGPPVPNLDIEIRDTVSNDPLPSGEVGEICVKGPTTVKGYLNKQEETAKTFVDGWVHTGDMGYLDDDGFLYVVDRLKDMIVSGGENIYSLEVENALMQHPSVMEAAVVGVPDERMQEAVKAVIFLKPGMTATEEEIIGHCKKVIASYKKPKHVVFTKEMLPKNPSGKVLKNLLKEM